eukprot:g60543.t1
MRFARGFVDAHKSRLSPVPPPPFSVIFNSNRNTFGRNEKNCSDFINGQVSRFQRRSDGPNTKYVRVPGLAQSPGTCTALHE